MTLPTPDFNALTHSAKLTDVIRKQIEKSGGFLSFARFMELALYAPSLGYYSAGTDKLGAGGDFITAPHISPLFTRCIAREFQSILDKEKRPDILELGAGSGLFAKDVLLELEILNCLPSHYFILEISPDLRARQQALLKTHCSHLLDRIEWLDTLPSHFSGVIFANEVMDAMPVHCFSGSQERCVTWENNQFAWTLKKPSNALAERFAELNLSFPDHYHSEINLALPAWIHSLADTLVSGVILLFDYGYGRSEFYHPDRCEGTLMCFYRHHKHTDPFQYVGLQDITAHVDFTTVAESAIDAGLELLGYTTQAGFLLGCGLLELAEKNAGSELDLYQQAQVIKTLTLPSQMGEVIKVMGLGKNFSSELKGFKLQDRRKNL